MYDPSRQPEAFTDSQRMAELVQQDAETDTESSPPHPPRVISHTGNARCYQCSSKLINTCYVEAGHAKCALCDLSCSLSPSKLDLDTRGKLLVVLESMGTMSDLLGQKLNAETQYRLRVRMAATMDDLRKAGQRFGGLPDAKQAVEPDSDSDHDSDDAMDG